MGVVQKDALKTTIISYFGLGLGYLNKLFLFIAFLSTVEIGLVNLLTSTGLLFAQLSNLGSVYVTWRFFPFFRNEAKKHYGFLMLNMLIVIFGLFLFSSLFFVFHEPIVELFKSKSPLFVDYAWWVIPIGIGNVFFQLFENHLRGMFKNVLPVFLQDIVLRLITTLLLVLYALKWLSFEHFLLCLFLSHLVPATCLFVYLILKKEIHLSLSSITVPKRFQKIILTFSLFSYVNTLATIFVVTMDAIMIGSMIGLAATGIYTSMVQITSAVLVPFRAMTRVSSPIVARYWKEKNMVGLQDIYAKSSGAGLFIGLVCFLAIWLPKDELFSFLKPEFKAGIPVLFFLLLGRLVDMYCGLNGIIFATSRKYKYDLLFTVFLCVGVYFLNLSLIPKYGITGVAFSTGFIYVFYNLARSLYIYIEYKLNPFSWHHLKPILYFLGVIGLYYACVFWFPLHDNATVFTKLFRVLFIEFYVLFAFIGPVIYFRWEPQSADFTRSFLTQIKNKWINR